MTGLQWWCYHPVLTCMKGTSLQRAAPKCQEPVKAVRGVMGAATTQIRMSASAMLQMYMLDTVRRPGLLTHGGK